MKSVGHQWPTNDKICEASTIKESVRQQSPTYDSVCETAVGPYAGPLHENDPRQAAARPYAAPRLHSWPAQHTVLTDVHAAIHIITKSPFLSEFQKA
jgi:hypothetical protein